MATYFHGNNDNNNTSEIQPSAEGLQTLYLMNPNYVPFSDSPQNPTPSMLFLNPNNNTSASTSVTHRGHTLNLASLSHAPPQHHHLVGVTIPASNVIGGGANAEEIPSFHGFTMAAGAPRVHYNLWGSIVDHTSSSVAAAAAVATVAAASSSNSGHVATVAGAAATDIGFHGPSHQQGLSLSLSSQQPSYRSFSGEMDAVSPASRGGGCGDVRVVGNSSGVSSMHSVVFGSKYLKAAQELLDEVVNVGNKGISIIEGASNSSKEKMKGNLVESTSGVGDGSSGGGESSGAANKQGGELSTAQRQELQMKKSKLVNMLDEVEQRYRQYHNQMQVVVSSFEQAAGFGAARCYTALALKTISKQFRCLKDAICSQIRATSKTLGEDDCLGAKLEGSRLRFVDHHLRQQRALQQLGMIQHGNAWRPQRGLPERAVSVLRAWLFEHFLHPYPKDSDKVMLAKQTGLTRSQVSNWFINARVRLWKPMVEEMYLEEVKDQDQNNGSSSQDNTNRSKESNNELWSTSNTAQEQAAIRLDQINVLQSKAESFNNINSHQNTSPTDQISNSNNNSMSTSPMGGGHPGNFLLAAGSSDMQRSPNKPRSFEIHNSQSSILSMDMEMKSNGETHSEANNNTKFGIERNHGGGGGGGYGAFSMEDIGRFNVTDHHHQQQQLAPRFHGNGVSLTLGLPPSENLPLSGTQHGFLSQNMTHLGGRLEINGNNENEFCAMNSTPPSSHSGTSYDNIDMQNRKRFAAQLLRDFVA